MSPVTKLLLTTLLILTACNSAPTLDQSHAQTKMDAFLQAVSTDTDTAYTETSTRFQSGTSADDFKTLVDQSKLKDWTSFSITGLEYQQGVGTNAAKVDGDIIFTDLTKQNASFIWSYDYTTKDWYLDAFRFNE